MEDKTEGRRCTIGNTISISTTATLRKRLVTYLTRTDLVEGDKREGLRQHRAWQVSPCQRKRNSDSTKEQLRQESQGLYAH